MHALHAWRIRPCFILQLWLRANEVKNTVRENLKTVSLYPKYAGFKKFIVFQVR